MAVCVLTVTAGAVIDHQASHQSTDIIAGILRVVFIKLHTRFH